VKDSFIIGIAKLASDKKWGVGLKSVKLSLVELPSYTLLRTILSSHDLVRLASTFFVFCGRLTSEVDRDNAFGNPELYTSNVIESLRKLLLGNCV